jgi:hypothetical protein
MEWHEGRPRLKLTCCRSAEELDAIFSSFLVDVAGVVGTADDSVLVVADDPSWPVDAADYDWLCGVIRDTLASHGITGVQMAFVPAPTAGRAEPGGPPDRGGE